MRLATCLLLAAPAAAQFPTIDSILPRGAQRGTTVEVSLRGRRLGSARELVFEPGGLQVQALEAEQDDRLKATLVVAPDAEPGPRAVWVRTAAGLSSLGTFHLGALPELGEAEPNGTPGEAQPIELGVTVNGVAANEDVDLYAFTGLAGERVSVELEGQRLGDRLFDPAIALLDPRGFALASCDDSALGRQDPVLSLELPADGRYLVQVRESAYRGANDCRYRLHVGRFPRPLAMLPLGGRPGEELELTLLDADGRTETTRAILAAPRSRGGWVPEQVQAVAVTTAAGMAPTPAWLRVVDLDNVLEVEPDEAFDAATPCVAPCALNGVLQAPGDVDRFRFEARKDETLLIAVHARSLRTPVDAVLSVHRANGQHMRSNDDEGGPDSRLEFKAPEDGAFVVSVRDHLARGGPAFAYRVELQRPRASIRVGIGGERPQVAVPRGGRTTLNLTVERRGYGGPVVLDLEHLPAGVTAHVPALPQGVNVVPVVFEASAEAAPASGLARVGARAGDARRADVTGALHHDVELVRGNNNRVFWAHTLDRLPVAVTDPAPAAVSVAAPGVPLPRAGRIRLEVTVERAEGFTGALTLRLPFLPPGVSAPRQLEVAADAAGARFDLDAAGDARLGRWEVVVAAECEGPHGRVLIAAPAVPVEVTGPLLALESEPVAVERGQSGELFVEVTRLAGFRGQATVDLIGLPHQVISEPQVVDATTESLVFPITTGAESPVGKHATLQFAARFQLPEGEVLQGLPAAELRVQQPAPPPAQAVAATAPRPEPQPAEKKERPPTRLEKLRAEHAARLAGGGEGGAR